MSSTKASTTITFTSTLRSQPTIYIHLRLYRNQSTSTSTSSSSKSAPLDEITLRTHLTASLSQYLGITGTAIPINIFKVEGDEAWIGLPREFESDVVASLSQWAGKGGIRLGILARSAWLGGLV